MRTRILLAAIALPLCLPVAVAQEEGHGPLPDLPQGNEASAPAAAPPAATADFSEGLKQLAALGLPEMKGAQWVQPSAELESGETLFSQSYEFREMRLTLKGGVWKLPGEPARFVDFGSPEAIAQADVGEDSKEAKVPLVRPAARTPWSRPNANPPKPATEKKADLSDEETDAKAIAGLLGKEEFRKELVEHQSYRPSPLPGRCLIFAAQLNAAGKTEAANEVARAVFSLPIEKENIIDGAVTQFADLAYEKVAKAFFEEHHDWAKYCDGVKAVLEKYPRGWDDAGAMAILLPLLEKRASGAPPPVPSLEGVELKPEALAALKQMLEPQGGKAKGADDAALARSHGIQLDQIPAAQRARILSMLRQQGMGDEEGSGDGPSGLWLLDEPEDGEAVNDPLSRLVAMKMDGLIALAAVATDETLVPQPKTGDSDHYSYSSHESAEEIARSHYESLDRPKTRGEIAMEWLEAAVPEDESRSSADTEGTALAAVEFWKEHRKDTPLKLALFYLNSSDRSKRSEAATYLSEREDPEAHAAFEKAVLDSAEPAEFADEVSSYLEQRKTEARSFFEAYSKALHAALDGVDFEQLDYSGGGYAVRNAGSVDQFLKPLAMKVGAVSLDELVDSAMKSGKAAEIAALVNPIGGSPMPDCLKVLGKAAEKAKPEQLMALYEVLLRRAYQDHRRRGGEEQEDAQAEKKAPAKPELPEEVRTLWRTLMARTDALPEGKKGQRSFGDWTKSYGGKNCGDTALLALELCVFPESGEALNPYADISGSYEVVLPFARKRVEAWMSGQEPPAWPSAEQVSEERKKELKDKLAQLPADGIIPWAQGLPENERMAVAETVRGYGAEDDPAPAGLLELKWKVTALKPLNAATPHDPILLEKLGIHAGMAIGYEPLGALTKKLAMEAKESSGTTLIITPGPMGLGCTATAMRSTDPKDTAIAYNYGMPLSRWFSQYESAEAIATLSIGGTADAWAPKDGKAEKLENKRVTPQDLPTLFAAKTGYLRMPVMIQVLTREDAEKINNHGNEEPEAEAQEEEEQ